MAVQCDFCNGTGKTLSVKAIIKLIKTGKAKPDEKCPICNGTGWRVPQPRIDPAARY
jgi:hypothetical protein